MPHDKAKPGLIAYLALFLLILFFSGLSGHLGPYLAWFDYTTLIGRFGRILDTQTFLGAGGTGARGGLLYAVSFIPSIMLAVGVVEVATRYGALKAAGVLLTPILRPLLGLPGVCGVAIFASLQSSDAGAAMTRELAEKDLVTDDECTILTAFEFSSGASVIFYLTVAAVLFPFLPVHFFCPSGWCSFLRSSAPTSCAFIFMSGDSRERPRSLYLGTT